MLPELSTQLHSSVDNAAQKCDSKADAAITATESKLNSAMEDLDKTMKENGVPTDVDNTTIKQMDAAGEGSQLSNGAIDQPVKGPTTVVKTTTEEQGKTVQLYANKSDVKRASEGSEQLQEVAGADGSNVTNVTNASSTQATFESKVLVNASGGAAGTEANVYEDMNAMMAEASRSNAAVENSLSNS